MNLSAPSVWDAVKGHVDNLVLLAETTSTHDVAARLIEQMSGEDQPLVPTLIIACRQTAGRGRGDRSWISPDGGLYLNWVRSDADPATANLLPVIAAGAAAAAIAAAGVAGVGLKWPNDLMLGDGKAGGVVITVRSGDSVWTSIGLGINIIAVPELPRDATHPAARLADHAAERPLQRWIEELASGFLGALSRGLTDPSGALERWRELLIHRPGDRLTVTLASGESATGEFAGTTDDGYLRLVIDGRERIITSGDVFGC